MDDCNLMKQINFHVPDMRTRQQVEKMFTIPVTRTFSHRYSPLYFMLYVFNVLNNRLALDLSDKHDKFLNVIKADRSQ